MNKLTIIGLLICFTLTCSAQESETTYYKNMSMDEEVPQEKAKYSKTITNNPDGSITTERKNLKKDLVESRQVLKGDEPIGNWIYLTGRGPAEMDYNFIIEYSDQECPKDFNIKNYFADDISIGYQSPKVSTGEQFYEFIGKNLVYPGKARRQGIHGKVELTFDITNDGLIENIRVKKGVHIILDKESVRILKKMKFSSPPKINGQPQALCANTAMTYRLE